MEVRTLKIDGILYIVPETQAQLMIKFAIEIVKGLRDKYQTLDIYCVNTIKELEKELTE